MADFTPAPPVDVQAGDAVRVALAATPRGVSYGHLASPAAWLAACQGRVPAHPPAKPHVAVFRGDNAIASIRYQGAGLSAYDPAATDEQAQEITAHAGPLAGLASLHGTDLSLVDVTAACGPAASIDTDDAVSVRALGEAFDLGAEKARSLAESGADLAIPASVTVGNSTVAAAVMGVITRTEPVQIVGPGSGITDAQWKTKVRVTRDAMFRARNFSSNPRELIQLIGSPELAALTAFIAECAQRRIPVLLGDALTATAAFLADQLSEGTHAWCYATTLTPEPAHRLALEHLNLEPLTDLDVRGSGVGSLSVLPLITAAVSLASLEVRVVSEDLP